MPYHGSFTGSVVLAILGTIIMIAHRLKTVRNADKILVLDGGKIVQQGTHEEQSAKPGIYSDAIQSISIHLVESQIDGMEHIGMRGKWYSISITLRKRIYIFLYKVLAP